MKKQILKGYDILSGRLLGVVMLTMLLMCSCTTTRYVPVIEQHTDTLVKTKYQRDSIYIHDSTFVFMNGDTVLIEKWHTKWRDRIVHDTLYQSKRDSIPYPVEVTKEVPANLTWWQQVRIHVGGVVLWLLLAVFCWCIGGILRKVLPFVK